MSDTDDENLIFVSRDATEEERASIGTGTPAPAAKVWLESTLSGDTLAAWPVTDPDLRAFRVQEWLCNNQALDVSDDERDAVVDGLIADEPTGPLWPAFALHLNLLHGEHLDEYHLEGWGFGRIVYHRLDLATINMLIGAPAAEVVVDIYSGIGLTMRKTNDAWRVIGFEGHIAVPGWPPTMTDAPGAPS